MLYKSTRNDKIRVSAAQAIAQGISEEGGLFVPEEIPSVKNRLSELSKLNYLDLAEEILGLYLSDYTGDEIKECVNKAYSNSKFGGEPVSLVGIGGGKYMLELWHGPTCAFKDMALQILPHLLTKALKKKYNGREAVILVATSGDTGKAALEGFKDVEGTKIIVFYPDNGVSPMQLRQMNTQEGKNVCVCGVEGNFDDCQTAVKRIFTDEGIKESLLENNMIFSSANSINWGRLLPQIIYYFYAYFQLYKAGKITSLDDKMDVAVPTGNFGNILAAYYAGRMGLPVGRLICASNSNNVLTDFINTGSYNKNRAFYTTASPSMDILVSSNLERLLYHLCGEDSQKLSGWMQALSNGGEYSVDEKTAENVKHLFYGGFCTDDETGEEILQLFTNEKYLADTHTAVAAKVYGEYSVSEGGKNPAVIVSTASPYKFGRSVLSAVCEVCPRDEFEIMDKLSRISGMDIPQPISSLKGKEIRFNNKCSRDSIARFVLKTIGVE